MKRRFVTIFAVLSAASVLWANPIDLTKAKRIASAYMSEGTTLEAVTSEVTTRSINSTGKAPLYIFNRGNNQGFVVVSGDDCLPEVLGYTEQGDFDPQNLPPALLEWIEGYQLMIEKAQEVNAAPRIITRATTTKHDIAPLVSAHWSQGAPYNNLCPYLKNGGGRSITGCVATAASQVIYYWRRELPRKSLYNTPTYSYGDAPVTESIPAGTPIKYELMQDNYTGSTPEDMNMAVATLMSVVGTSTWLTYGSSTSGEIPKLVDTFWGQFRMSSTCTYKGSSQSEWENLIYEDLEKGWPIVYSGVSPSQGGHAVVVDGYRASDNLFHFNFGWGGQGDGYFTVNDTNGMNGFNGSQGMTHKINPVTTLLAGKINYTGTLSTRMSNPIEVEITNNGTVAKSGVYLIASKTDGEPENVTKANAKDLTTMIQRDSTETITLSYRPTTTGTYHLYLVDANATVMDHITVEAVEQEPILALEDLSVRNSQPVSETVVINNQSENITVNYIYDEDAEVVAMLSNSEEATSVTPLFNCKLYAYNEVQGTFELRSNISESDMIFKRGETKEKIFTLKALNTDKIYSAHISKTYKIGTVEYEMDVDKCDTIIYFKVQGVDLALTETEDNGAKLTGHWNGVKFKGLAHSTTLTYYDLTEVQGVNTQPEAANPNALFYVSKDATATGYNIIKDGVCENLRLTYGNNFGPKEDFTAQQATFDPKSSLLQWSYIALPFDCEVPAGSMARCIKKLTNTLISEADATNTKVESGIPYLYKSTCPGKDLFRAGNVTVSPTPKDFSDSLKVTFTTIVGTADEMILNTGSQKFTSAKNATIPAFSGYLSYTKEVGCDAYQYYDQDKASAELADVLVLAYETEIKYKGKVPEDIWNAFITEQEKAADCYTQQPSIQEMKDVAVSLTEKLNAVRNNELFLGSPVDLTELYIENPSFESGRITGWETTRSSGQLYKVTNTSTLAEYTVGTEGTYVFYSYSNTGKGSASISQTITDMPEGIYRLSAKLGTEEGQSVTLHANEKSATVTDDGFGLRYLTETVIDSIRVENGTLELGINGTEYDYKADDFRLYYIGPLETAITDTYAKGNGNIRAWGGEGFINLLAEEGNPTEVRIYGLDGKLCKQMTIEGFRRIGNLQKGIYIVNRQKVMVR